MSAGYGPAYVHVVGHFSLWLTNRYLSLSDINGVLVERFVAEHLVDCRCPAPCQRGTPTVRAALGHLLRVLRDRYLISPPSVDPSDIDRELSCFDAHMKGVAGLADATRVSRMDVASEVSDWMYQSRTRWHRADPASGCGCFSETRLH